MNKFRYVNKQLIQIKVKFVCKQIADFNKCKQTAAINKQITLIKVNKQLTYRLLG